MMMMNAAQAELYRLSKNRSTLFWAILFVPLVFVLGVLAVTFSLKSKAGDLDITLPPAGVPINLAADIVTAAGGVQAMPLMLFTLIAAATLSAGDYRWETWRLVMARNSRTNLVAGKIMALVVIAVASTVLYFAAAMIAAASTPLIAGRGISLDMSATQVSHAATLYLIALWRVIQFLLLSLVAATLTRSLLAALFIPIVISVGQTLGQNMALFVGLTPMDWQTIMFSPGLAASHLQATVTGPSSQAVVWASLGSMTLWSLGAIALTLAIFQHQGLSKE